jgi:hypothetical protein
MAALLTPSDIPATAAEYEQTRDAYRRRIMVLKQPRRILIGPNCSVHFENREIMRYQICEMLRAESTFGNEDSLEDELHAYNPLISQPNRLSATFMFEFPSEEQRARELSGLVGIHEHVWLQVGDDAPIAGEFDVAQLNDRRVSSVQFVKFTLTDAQQDAISKSGTVVRIRIDHPKYTAQAVLGEETRAALAADLSDDA